MLCFWQALSENGESCLIFCDELSKMRLQKVEKLILVPERIFLTL